MNKANHAQYESDLSSGTEKKSNDISSLPLKRIRKPNFKLIDDEVSSDDGSEDFGNKKIKLSSFPTFSQTGSLLNNIDDMPFNEIDEVPVMSGQIANVNIIEDNLNVIISNDDINNCNQENLSKNYQTIDSIDTIEDLQKYIDTMFGKWQPDTSRLLITIGLHQKEQLQYLENIQSMVNNISTVPINSDDNASLYKEEDIIYSRFPATSLDLLHKLDNDVKILKSTKMNVYNALVKNMSLIGGLTLGELLRRILKKVLTDEVAEQLSWFGRQKKISFANTGLADLIKSTVKIKFKDESDKNIEVIAGTWLAKAKERQNKKPTQTD